MNSTTREKTQLYNHQCSASHNAIPETAYLSTLELDDIFFNLETIELF